MNQSSTKQLQSRGTRRNRFLLTLHGVVLVIIGGALSTAENYFSLGFLLHELRPAYRDDEATCICFELGWTAGFVKLLASVSRSCWRHQL
jgi:hypothetical protein